MIVVLFERNSQGKICRLNIHYHHESSKQKINDYMAYIIYARIPHLTFPKLHLAPHSNQRQSQEDIVNHETISSEILVTLANNNKYAMSAMVLTLNIVEKWLFLKNTHSSRSLIPSCSLTSPQYESWLAVDVRNS